MALRNTAMQVSRLYKDDSEMKVHRSEIEYISVRHLDIPYQKVSRLYEIVLRHYKQQARITDFLVVLTGRRVEYLLRKVRGRQPGESR